ncbi:MAG: PD-(D/E)XK nuclease family protein [Armatimonadota bacterium]
MPGDPPQPTMPSVHIICGTKGSGKTTTILRRCREQIEQRGPDSVVLLAPSARRAAELREALLGQKLEALFDDRITTFPQLADLILTANHEPAALIGPVTQRLILREVLRQLSDAGELEYLTEVRDFPGFVGALADFITELKRAAVDTEAFAAAFKRAGLAGDRRSQELSAIYRAYQQQLHDLSVYDDAGRFWWAREVLARGDRRPLERARLLLVDGFDEFTTTELDVLALLAQPMEETVITLPLERQTARAELFAVPRRTLARLRERFPEAEVRELPPPTADGPLPQLGQALFARPVRAAPGPDGALRIIEVAGLHQEAEEIAREAKRLIVEQGVPPDDIAVVFRRLGEYGSALRGAFRRLGVPLYVAAPESAAQRPIVGAILAAYEAVAGGFRRADVLSLAKSNYVQPPAPTVREADGDGLDLIARRAGIVAGRESWQQRLDVHQRRLQRELDRVQRGEAREGDRLEHEIAAELAALAPAREMLEWLFSVLDALPASGSLPDHVQAAKQLIEDLGIARRVAPFEAPGFDVERPCAEDAAAFEALMECLDELAAAAPFSHEQLSLTEYQRLLHDALSQVTYQPEASREGRVLALDAHRCRQLRFPYVIIGGLIEREFPLRRQERPFYDDEERARLQCVGAPLDTSRERQQHEALLFWSAATSATEQLILTYPVTDAEGKDILTSHYVDEVLRCFEGQPHRIEVPVSRVVPELAQASCPSDLLERAFLDLGCRGGVDEAVSAAAYNACLTDDRLGDPARSALVGASVASERDSLRPFGEYDGMIGDDGIGESLAARYPPDCRFSASQFDEYGTCPIAYMFARVLGLEPLEDPVENVEALERGSIYHQLLGELFPALQQQLGTTAIDPQLLPDAQRLLESLVADYFDSRARQGMVCDAALWQIEQEECLRNLSLLLRHEQQLAAEGHRPWLFEAPYGMSEDDQPLRIAADGQEVLVRGRIDRVDRVKSEDGEGYAVIDYKLGGGSSTAAILAGQDFQLPIYAMAAKLVGVPGECRDWFYYKLRRPTERSPKRPPDIGECLAAARQHLIRYAAQIRRGEFPPAARGCPTWCPYREICRGDRWRTEKKTGEQAQRPTS